VFVTGFVSNVLIAGFLAWLGDYIGLNLLLAVSLVMGWRVFNNLSMIRRHILNRWLDARARRGLDQGTGN
jgi:small basic protein